MPPVRASKLQELSSSKQQIAHLAGQRAVHEAFVWFRSHETQLADWQMEFTAIPAPPFGEAARAAWLKSRFKSLGLEKVEIDEAGNVLGTLRGAAPGQSCVALSAHIDTVFPAGTPIKL